MLIEQTLIMREWSTVRTLQPIGFTSFLEPHSTSLAGISFFQFKLSALKFERGYERAVGASKITERVDTLCTRPTATVEP